MNHTRSERPTLVLAGTGKVGRRVVQRLEARGLPVRVGSRSGDPRFDWQDSSTWAPALADVGAVYIAYAPDIAVPGAVETTAAFAELAVRSGVTRHVLLSGRGEPEAEEAERAVRAAGGNLTVLRSTWFAQNFSEDYLLDGILDGVVPLPAGNTPEPFVDAEDIADVAVAALTDPRHIGETYELTGARLLTFAQAVDEIAAATGRDIRYIPITIEEHTAMARQHGVPAEVSDLLAYLFGSVLDGRNAHLADGVERALRRPPRDFADYVRDAAASGVWHPTVATVR